MHTSGGYHALLTWLVCIVYNYDGGICHMLGSFDTKQEEIRKIKFGRWQDLSATCIQIQIIGFVIGEKL